MNYRCICLEKVGKDRFRKIHEIKFNPEKHVLLEYKGKEQTIPLTAEMYAYEDKKTTYILWDVTDNQIIKFNGNDIGINSKFLDKFLTTSKVGIVGQLMMAVHLGLKGNVKDWSKITPFIWLIIGGVFGFLAGGGMG